MPKRRKQDAGGYYRLFNGKKYHAFSNHHTKKAALKMKDSLKKAPTSRVRITKSGKFWTVWHRGRLG